MTIWRSLKTTTEPAKRLLIEDGQLFYFRDKGAVTQIDIDHLAYVELRVLQNKVYWYLQDQAGHFVLVPEALSEIGVLRRYLSSWRGFNYHGLLHFDPLQQQRLRLWPLHSVGVA